MPFLNITIDFDKLSILGVKTSLQLIPNERQYILGNENSSILVKLEKRSEYPTTYCYRTAADTYRLGYGKNYSENDEFLKIEINGNGELRIQRDCFAVLPLFYGRSKNVFCASNEFDKPIDTLPNLTLNKPLLLRIISTRDLGFMNETLVHEVKLLLERELLLVKYDEFALHQPQDRTWGISSEAMETDPLQFMKVFDEYIEHFLQTRLSHDTFAYEVSGGIDSSILPLRLKDEVSTGSILASILYNGNFGITQKQKLDTISAYTGLPLLFTTINDTKDFPFADILYDHTPFHHVLAPEEVPFTRIARMVKEKNAKIICQGIGGDEICENILSTQFIYGFGTDEINERKNELLPPYLTATFRKEFLNTVNNHLPHALPLHSHSQLDQQLSNNIYIQQGLWSVSPFAYPGLYRFCQGLPAYLRVDKKILRMYCTAYEYPESIYHPTQNENFLPFLDNSFTAMLFALPFKEILSHSFSIKLGYVEPDLLIKEYNKIYNLNSIEDWEGYQLYCWLLLELSLVRLPQSKLRL